MIHINKTIITQRAESFTVGFLVSKEFKGKEFPYWAEAGLANPHYLLQVRNSEFFEKDKGSVYNYWIPCRLFIPGGTTAGYNLLQCHGSPQAASDDNGPASAKNGDLYYEDLVTPKFHVKIDYSGIKGHLDVTWTMFKHTFLPLDIAQFRQGTWWYDIRLVAGVKMVDYLRGRYESFFHDRDYDGKHIEMDVHAKREYELYGQSPKWLYDRICALEPLFREEVNWEHPLANYQTVDRLAYPEKFIVR